ncbi:FdrA family protein [Microtetraspora sp. NBRC 13810]|uniref:FdrA family protein n=1 Tax=Microtetraspora sp. NBRC 13810 TaxID=3030990 RepID=UPI002554C1F8|nr:FdrA family protein [Microtetraspora sp. NBRC 13810]
MNAAGGGAVGVEKGAGDVSAAGGGAVGKGADLVFVRSGVYHDSVGLMRVSRALGALPGVETAIVAMATELNAGLAREAGFTLPAAGPADLLVAVRAADDTAARAAAAELDRLLADLASRTAGPGREQAPPRTVGKGAAGSAATLALVSVPGEHAFPEALDAIEAGLSVMVFSDNVPVDQEVLLKERAEERGVLVMGPDCGTAVIGGVGLGFANVLRPGPVGVVAASGTGAQQVTCLLDLAGVGVSHVLGVGGRDLSERVAGRSTLRALAALDADPATELIVLISKPPAPEVARAVLKTAAGLATPVVTAFLGPSGDLTTATLQVLTALGVPTPPWPAFPAAPLTAPTPPSPTAEAAPGPPPPPTETTPAQPSPGTEAPPTHLSHSTESAPTQPSSGVEAAPAQPTQSGEGAGGLWGIYAGGTLCAEAAGIAGRGTFVDYGDDEYTRGRPHPMIDPVLRIEALAAVPPGGVALLDVVLGHGADPDPVRRLGPEVAAAVARGVAVVVAVVGSEGDPQGLDRQIAGFRAAGAGVFVSNAQAARHAAALAGSDVTP